MYQVSRHTLTQFFSALKRGVHIVNLDPANERVPYPCDISLSDLISVSDVMAELDLGPNGAMLYCMEYLEHNIDWLESRLAALEHDYVLFDLPGQVELSTNHPSLQRILERLQKQDWRVEFEVLQGSGRWESPLMGWASTYVLASSHKQCRSPAVSLDAV